jgi:hypothetical protein
MSELDELPDGAHKLLATTLRELVPAAWRIVPVERNVDELDATTVVIKLDSVRRIPEAPKSGRYFATWTVTVATPHIDPTLGDPDIFDSLLALLDALELVDWLEWTAAQKVVESSRYAFDITLDTITKREETT